MLRQDACKALGTDATTFLAPQPPACPQNFIGWADAGTIVYPQEAGFPFGAGETRSILLEMHYENLAGTRGIVDTSGLEFTCVLVLSALPHRC
jgi:hypothetical protein